MLGLSAALQASLLEKLPGPAILPREGPQEQAAPWAASPLPGCTS